MSVLAASAALPKKLRSHYCSHRILTLSVYPFLNATDIFGTKQRKLLESELVFFPNWCVRFPLSRSINILLHLIDVMLWLSLNQTALVLVLSGMTTMSGARDTTTTLNTWKEAY
jgi:hypothetical protein